MDRTNHKNKNIEELTPEELMEFLDESNTYFIKDDKSGIVGNKKTGLMLDRRTGKTFSHEHSEAHYKDDFLSDLKYDFLDYQKSLDLLNASDDLEYKEGEDNINKSSLSLKKYVGRKVAKLNKKSPDINEIDKSININNFDNIPPEDHNSKVNDIEETSQLGDNNLNDQDKDLVSRHSEDNNIDHVNLSEVVDKGYKDIGSYKDDAELLENINSRFNILQSDLGYSKSSNTYKKDMDYSFSSFEDFKGENKSTDNDESNIQDKEVSVLDKFKSIMDFEDYLLIMEDDDSILKSPFDETEVYEELKIVVENNNDDSFTPFDTRFDVEEIESYSVNNENVLEEGMIPDINLNQSISRKVSIREVIKHKQKKKQEQKDLQDKLFFETLDERIEEFKNYEENNIDSKDILNAINVDLNKINSSIKVEFQSLNKNRNKKVMNNSKPSNDDKFSLQTLLEDIYEEKGDNVNSLDVQDLDIEAIKKDLANNEDVKHMVN